MAYQRARSPDQLKAQLPAVAPRFLEQYRKAGLTRPALPPPTAAPVNPAMAKTRAVLGDMQRLLGILNGDSRAYETVRNLAQELIETIRQAKARL